MSEIIVGSSLILSNQDIQFSPHAAWWSALLYGRENSTESSAPLSWNMPMRNTPSSVQSNDLKLLELHQTTHKQQQCRCWCLTDPASIDQTRGCAIGTVELILNPRTNHDSHLVGVLPDVEPHEERTNSDTLWWRWMKDDTRNPESD